LGATAQPNKPAPKNRDPDQSLFFDARPSTPDQSLSKSSEKKADAEAAFMQGLILEEDGDYDSALEAYTKSLQLDPGGNPQIAIRVANEYVKREEVPTALDLLKDAGIDMTTDEPLDLTMKKMNRVMDEMEKVLDQQGK